MRKDFAQEFWVVIWAIVCIDQEFCWALFTSNFERKFCSRFFSYNLSKVLLMNFAMILWVNTWAKFCSIISDCNFAMVFGVETWVKFCLQFLDWNLTKILLKIFYLQFEQNFAMIFRVTVWAKLCSRFLNSNLSNILLWYFNLDLWAEVCLMFFASKYMENNFWAMCGSLRPSLYSLSNILESKFKIQNQKKKKNIAPYQKQFYNRKGMKNRTLLKHENKYHSQFISVSWYLLYVH